MPHILTWLLANIFTALLPPLDKEEEDFYDILELPRNATNEQVRKSYKLLSLRLHPDKVAQRKEGNAQDAAARYEKVQEAYGVLVNDIKCQKYRALQYSPKRYRFINQGAFSNPGAIYENLTNATTVDKTRLVVLCTVIVLTLLVQPILIATKVNHTLEGGGLESSTWVALLTPTWIMGALWVIFHCILVIVTPPGAKLSMVALSLDYMLWYIGIVLLALKWDGSVSAPYGQVFIPLYLAVILRWLSKVLLMIKIQSDVGRMVTMEYLEREVTKGKSLEDMTEEEQETIRQSFIVVTVSPDFEIDLENTDAMTTDENGEPLDKDVYIELHKVEASPEYESAMDLYYSTMGNLVGSVVFGLVFMIVLTLKLDRHIEASYWVVFIPVWIHFGSRWTFFFYKCACGPSEEVFIRMDQQGHEEQAGGDEEAGNSDTERPKDPNFVDANESTLSLNANVLPEKQATKIAPTPVVTGTGTTISTPPGEVGKTELAPENAEEWKSDGGDDVVNERPKGDGDGIHIDEETYRAWQNAYEEAENGAVEEQAKASAEWCCLTVQLMVLIMVVAKIDQGYWENDDDSSDHGFNAFWILFPFFLFFGLVLCCCACLIYSAEPGTASDFQGLGGVEVQPANEATVATESIVLTPPPVGEVAATSQTPPHVAVVTGVKPAEVPDIEDLD